MEGTFALTPSCILHHLLSCIARSLDILSFTAAVVVGVVETPGKIPCTPIPKRVCATADETSDA